MGMAKLLTDFAQCLKFQNQLLASAPYVFAAHKMNSSGASQGVTASSLIVVSNRLPFVLRRESDNGGNGNGDGDDDDKDASKGPLVRCSSAGGLVTAVAPVVVQSGGLWVGWPGTQLGEGDEIPESRPDDVSPTAGLKSSQVLPVNLDEEDYEMYYKGCCNGTFWPLFHSMPDRAIFNEKFWTAYKCDKLS